MLQPSSSEDDLDEDVLVAAPVTLSAQLRSPRQVVTTDDDSHPTGNQCSPASNIDQRSLSAISRGSGGSGDNVSLSGTTSGGSSSQMLYSASGVVARPSSPSLSMLSSCVDGLSVVGRDTDLDQSEREEEERRRRIQLYVFVLRCIAYPFSAKQPTDTVRRQAKVTKQQLQSIRERFQVRRHGYLCYYDFSVLPFQFFDRVLLSNPIGSCSFNRKLTNPNTRKIKTMKIYVVNVDKCL